MLLWKSSFNNIVRSHEAAIIGLLLGIIMGVTSMFFVPIVVSEDQLLILPEYCDSIKYTEKVYFSYTGKIIKAVCKNGVISEDI